MTDDAIEQEAIIKSGEIAYAMSSVFMNALMDCSEELLQAHFLQMATTICATSLSIMISDICRLMKLDTQESLLCHAKLITEICDTAQMSYQNVKKKADYN